MVMVMVVVIMIMMMVMVVVVAGLVLTMSMSIVNGFVPSTPPDVEDVCFIIVGFIVARPRCARWGLCHIMWGHGSPSSPRPSRLSTTWRVLFLAIHQISHRVGSTTFWSRLGAHSCDFQCGRMLIWQKAVAMSSCKKHWTSRCEINLWGLQEPLRFAGISRSMRMSCGSAIISVCTHFHRKMVGAHMSQTAANNSKYFFKGASNKRALSQGQGPALPRPALERCCSLEATILSRQVVIRKDFYTAPFC